MSEARIAGIMLAAGESRRLGRPKQLLRWRGQTLIARAAQAALKADLEPVIVVIGAQAPAMRAALSATVATIVENPDWPAGMSTSMQAGVRALPAEVEAAIMLPVDQPRVDANHLRVMVDAYRRTGKPIVASAFQGRRTSPTLFARPLFEELMRITGDEGGRSIIAAHPDQVETIESPIDLADIDTLEDWQRMTNRSRINGLIIDMDGVLWRGNEPLPGLAEFFAFLRARDIRFVLATNNSSRTEAQYAERLAAYGAPVSPEEIVTSSSAAAEYLGAILPSGSPVYAIGMQGVRDALTRRGFALSEADGAAAVVVGIDWNVTYSQLKRAALLIRSGAKFIGTNPDATFPAPEGIIPGNGALLAAIETATSVKPIIVGKPEPILYQHSIRRLNLPLEQIAALGDRLETDILGGIRAGIRTILVMSGVTTPDLLAASDIELDWVFEDIGDLVKRWDEVMNAECRM